MTFEEWTTVCCQLEACLNSRPLGPLTFHATDGATPLTPGHFLVGRPLMSYHETDLPHEPSMYRTWVKAQAVVRHFWVRWSREYLTQLQASTKWRRPFPNFQAGDMVLVGDCRTFQSQWVMGRVIDTFPGQDGLVTGVARAFKKWSDQEVGVVIL